MRNEKTNDREENYEIQQFPGKHKLVLDWIQRMIERKNSRLSDPGLNINNCNVTKKDEDVGKHFR